MKEAKLATRRQNDLAEESALRAWGIRDVSEDAAAESSTSAPCELVDIGANLVKLKGNGTLEHQLRRAALTGVTTVICTGTCDYVLINLSIYINTPSTHTYIYIYIHIYGLTPVYMYKCIYVCISLSSSLSPSIYPSIYVSSCLSV